MKLKTRIHKLECAMSRLLADANKALDDMRTLHENQVNFASEEHKMVPNLSYYKLDKTIEKIVRDFADVEFDDDGNWKVVSRIRSLNKVLAARVR